jgi:hypothetical protein
MLYRLDWCEQVTLVMIENVTVDNHERRLSSTAYVAPWQACLPFLSQTAFSICTVSSITLAALPEDESWQRYEGLSFGAH